MDTTLSGDPLDDLGRLVHEEDAAAQLALAMVRLESALDEAGAAPADLTSLRVRTTDRSVLVGVLDVLTDRLATLGAAPDVTVIEADRLAVPGMLVELEAATEPPTTHPSKDES